MARPTRLDFESPAPLYHQIAESIRARIEGGELSPGDALTPLREAAEAWGVNLHTVRHAYAELARDGLVQSQRALGTRVTGRAKKKSITGAAPIEREDREAFIARVAREATDRWGMTARELGEEMMRRASERESDGDGREVVYVVECSQRQCEDLARQIEEAWDVEARPWRLDREGEPPEGAVVATYFHFNEVRLRWPRRLARVRFASIVVDPGLARRVRAHAGARGSERVVATLHEFDQPTLDAVAADLSVALPESRFEVRTRLIERASEAVTGRRRGVALVAPRVWGGMTEDERASGRALEARYVFEAGELASMGRELGWMARGAGR